MSDPLFRVVCVPAALAGVPDGWAVEMLRDGAIALQADDTGLEGLNGVAHVLGAETVSLVRSEDDPDRQDAVVMAHAGRLPLVWMAPSFSDAVRAWARDRAPMTLLVTAGAGLPEDERRRVERFVALLGRQSE